MASGRKHDVRSCKKIFVSISQLLKTFPALLNGHSAEQSAPFVSLLELRKSDSCFAQNPNLTYVEEFRARYVRAQHSCCFNVEYSCFFFPFFIFSNTKRILIFNNERIVGDATSSYERSDKKLNDVGREKKKGGNGGRSSS